MTLPLLLGCLFLPALQSTLGLSPKARAWEGECRDTQIFSVHLNLSMFVCAWFPLVQTLSSGAPTWGAPSSSSPYLFSSQGIWMKNHDLDFLFHLANMHLATDLGPP